MKKNRYLRRRKQNKELKIDVMSDKKTGRQLSEGFQSFEELRDNKCVYVDKTDMVWELANSKKYIFLSRPRRFGKSLLTSTLQCYFEGKKDLFNGLKIMDKETEWVSRPVFKFDFSNCITADDLLEKLDVRLGEYEAIYGKNPAAKNPGNRMLMLLKNAYLQSGIQSATLVDEYDFPLQHSLFNEAEHERLVKVYQNFFPPFKEYGNYLKCLFLTGCTKFTNLGLFSINNANSIVSSWPKYATLCGITKQELIDNYMPEIKELGEKKGWTVEETIEELRNMYDGYRFSSDMDKAVYNPFSLVNALAEKEITNYWISSGGSTMLNEMLIRSDENRENLEECSITENKLDMSDVGKGDIKLFLYQTGYLTIKEHFDGGYTLGIPNREVREAIYEILLPNAMSKENDFVDSTISDMRKALKKGDIVGMLENMKLLISQIPYPSRKEEHYYEERFQYFVSCALYLCGCTVNYEVPMSTGRIDLVAKYKNIIMAIELKLDNNGGVEAAKKQLKERNYTSALTNKGKDVYAVAISFSTEDNIRGVSGYDVKKI